MPHHASASLIFLQDGKCEVSQEAGSHRTGVVCTLILLVSLAKFSASCLCAHVPTALGVKSAWLWGLVAGGGCGGVVVCFSPGFSCHTQPCAHHHDLLDDPATLFCWWLVVAVMVLLAASLPDSRARPKHAHAPPGSGG